MKVAFLSFYQGFVNRGVETFVSETSKRLNADIKTYQAEKITNIHDTSDTLPRKFFLDDQSLKILFFTVKIFPDLIKNKYDIILPTNGGWQTLLCKIACIFTGAKLVVSGQSGKGFDDRWNLLMHPDLFIALSGPAENWAKKYSKNVIKIPNGVDLNKFNPGIKPAQIPLKRPIVLCVSALTAQKRIPLLIHAIASKNKFSLIVIGQGSKEEKEKINHLGKSFLGDRFLLIEVRHSEIAPYYKACDVFTLPSSSSEAFGIVLVEAMACGLPVVATCDDVRKEIVGDVGVLVDPANTEEYSKALEVALNTKWGNKLRLQAENFSWDKIAKNYEEEFNKICLSQ